KGFDERIMEKRNPTAGVRVVQGLIIAIGLLVVVFVFLIPARSHPPMSIVVYGAQDQFHAEPILQQFERETGIKVKAVYDSEAVKTVGLANRLLAERSHPQCDVFWGNEEMRTR